MKDKFIIVYGEFNPHFEQYYDELSCYNTEEEAIRVAEQNDYTGSQIFICKVTTILNEVENE